MGDLDDYVLAKSATTLVQRIASDIQMLTLGSTPAPEATASADAPEPQEDALLVYPSHDRLGRPIHRSTSGPLGAFGYVLAPNAQTGQLVRTWQFLPRSRVQGISASPETLARLQRTRGQYKNASEERSSPAPRNLLRNPPKNDAPRSSESCANWARAVGTGEASQVSLVDTSNFFGRGKGISPVKPPC